MPAWLLPARLGGRPRDGRAGARRHRGRRTSVPVPICGAVIAAARARGGMGGKRQQRWPTFSAPGRDPVRAVDG